MMSNDHCTRILVFHHHVPSFYVYFYGLEAKDLCTVPCSYVQTMMERRGFFPPEFNSSIFTVEQIR